VAECVHTCIIERIHTQKTKQKTKQKKAGNKNPTKHNKKGVHDERGKATGPTGDQAESTRASSGRPDLPMSISLAACRARPSAIATQKAHFAFFAIFRESEKRRG